jgi:hypothetical protein
MERPILKHIILKLLTIIVKIDDNIGIHVGTIA